MWGGGGGGGGHYLSKMLIHVLLVLHLPPNTMAENEIREYSISPPGFNSGVHVDVLYNARTPGLYYNPTWNPNLVTLPYYTIVVHTRNCRCVWNHVL